MATFKELLKLSFKSEDTEEWLDVHFTRPIGLVFALLWNKLDIHPNVITIVSIFLGISQAGVPLAMSRLISEYNALEYYEAKERIYKVGRTFLNIIGIISFLILFFSSAYSELRDSLHSLGESVQICLILLTYSLNKEGNMDNVFIMYKVAITGFVYMGSCQCYRYEEHV